MSKPICSIPRCKSRNKEVHARDWCKNHYNSWLAHGDPEKARPRAAKGSGGSKPLTVKSMKELGLYTAFDVSRWCARHGIQSVYLEYKGDEYMEVEHYYMTPAMWYAKDSKLPGKVLKKFSLTANPRKGEVFQQASAWVEAVYNVPMKPIACMKAAFPAPAVDLLLKELEIIRKIWSPDPQVVAEIPQETYVRAVKEYRVPQKVQATRKVEV